MFRLTSDKVVDLPTSNQKICVWEWGGSPSSRWISAGPPCEHPGQCVGKGPHVKVQVKGDPHVNVEVNVWVRPHPAKGPKRRGSMRYASCSQETVLFSVTIVINI